MNKIYRSNTNKIIGGVCGGIGEYLSISPDIIRALFVIVTFMNGIGFVAYIVAMLLIPQAPPGYISTSTEAPFSFGDSTNKNTIGLILIAVGVLLTLKRLFHIDDIIVTSIVLIAVGVYIIVKGGKK